MSQMPFHPQISCLVPCKVQSNKVLSMTLDRQGKYSYQIVLLLILALSSYLSNISIQLSVFYSSEAFSSADTQNVNWNPVSPTMREVDWANHSQQTSPFTIVVPKALRPLPQSQATIADTTLSAVTPHVRSNFPINTLCDIPSFI